jgi:hypothetical protein
MLFRGISRQRGLGGDQQTNWNDGATAFSIMTYRMMTLSTMDENCDTQRSVGLIAILLSVITLSVNILSVIMLSFVIMSVIMLRVVAPE